MRRSMGRLSTGASLGSAVLTATLLTSALLAGCGTTAPTAKGPAPVSCVPDDNGRSGAGHFRFNTSACENGTNNVTIFTLPLHVGVSNGQTVYYVIMDTSDEPTSDALGVNFAPKLANAVGTKGVQKVTMTPSGV